jgi:acetyltransferase-like isoleucine patch superfamily enzyme
MGFAPIRLLRYCPVASQFARLTPHFSFLTSAGMPFIFQGSTARGINIGNNVWIGAGAIILDGVTLGDNVVVGAGTVVSEAIPSGCLVTASRDLNIVALRSNPINQQR